jgi:hypothetical protein
MLVNLASGASAGMGLPLPAGGILAFGHDLPAVNNSLFVLGTASDKLLVWEA